MLIDIFERSDESLVFDNKAILLYEGCSNMNASVFITFFTYMLRQMSYLSGKNYPLPLKWHQA